MGVGPGYLAAGWDGIGCRCYTVFVDVFGYSVNGEILH